MGEALLDYLLTTKTTWKIKPAAIRPLHGGRNPVGPADHETMGIEETTAVFVQRTHDLGAFIAGQGLLAGINIQAAALQDLLLLGFGKLTKSQPQIPPFHKGMMLEVGIATAVSYTHLTLPTKRIV